AEVFPQLLGVAKTHINRFQPAQVYRREWHIQPWLHSAQRLQLGQSEQTIGDQELSRRSRLPRLGAVVFGDEGSQVATRDTPSVRAKFRPRDQVAELINAAAVACAVPSDVAGEDAAGAASRQSQGERQRAVEMHPRAKAEGSRQIDSSARRQLMFTVEPIRPERLVGVIVVHCRIDEVSVLR